jgi:hypothetical protein
VGSVSHPTETSTAGCFDVFPKPSLVHRHNGAQKACLSEVIKVGLEQFTPPLSRTAFLREASGYFSNILADGLDIHWGDFLSR